MNTTSNTYATLRALGWSASQAHRTAKAETEWQALGGFETYDKADDNGEDHPTVRLLYVPDEDPMKPEEWDSDKAQQDEWYAKAERHGVYGIVGQFWTGTEWETADSCWGFLGDDLKRNGYDTDISLGTIEAYSAHLELEACELEATRPDLYGLTFDGSHLRVEGSLLATL